MNLTILLFQDKLIVSLEAELAKYDELVIAVEAEKAERAEKERKKQEESVKKEETEEEAEEHDKHDKSSGELPLVTYCIIYFTLILNA